MIRRILLLATATIIVVAGAVPALAEKRIALVIGNSAYQNVSRLDNPRNDATLMASTLKELGFALVGDGPQLDLDKAGLDLAVQKFGSSLQGADVGMFYYAGHGVQVRGANYLVPVSANPTREADVDFQMVDVNLVLRQMEGAGTKLNLVVLDACRNNPFGARGLRSADGGLAQMRAPEGTLISFATQPGNVALDGDGNSPYTKALAETVRQSGLGIFQIFNEVGLAVKRSTGGSQQPWVSSSPIDGNFYFVAPPEIDKPAAGTDNAAQAWAATRDTTSLAVIDTFIRQYGDSIYGPFARARRDELRNSQLALAIPKPSVAETRPVAPRLTRADVIKLFEPFNLSMAQVQQKFFEKREDRDLFAAAITAMQRAFPPGRQIASAGAPEIRSSSGDASRGGDLDHVYEAALAIMNDRTSDSDDTRVVGVAIKGMLASLDPHSGYLTAKELTEVQTQNRGVFGGVGLQVNLTDGLLKVVSPTDDSPAAKAGILASDVIVAIDDASTQGFSLSQAVEKLRGPVNSKVKLKVIRQNLEHPIEVTLVRETIHNRSVRSRIEGGDTGYIKITMFNEETNDTFRQAIDGITKQVANDNLKGYVLDLRNSFGGLLNQVVLVSDALLERGEIASTRGRNTQDVQHFSAKPGDLAKGKRIIELINGGTASGSEILAGALHDNKRATLVGTRSFGRGSVQTIIPLGGDNGALRLTTSLYFTPSGTSIQAKGIVPDIEVLQDEPDDPKNKRSPAGEATLSGHIPAQGVEQIASQSYVPPDPSQDKALITALNLLHAGPAKTHAPASH